MFLPHPQVKVSIVGSLRDREVACSASDRQGSNFESCVWRTVSSQSSHHPQEVLMAQFSLYVHKGGLKPDSFHFCINQWPNGYFPFAISIRVLVSSFCFIWIPMLWVHDHYKLHILSVWGSTWDVIIWCLQTSDHDILSGSPHWKCVY